MTRTNSHLGLVLASTSRYRKELLTRLHLQFRTHDPGVEEIVLPNESAAETASRLAIAKAKAVSDLYPDSLTIGSDQVAVCDQKLLPKPLSHERAVHQLRHASGRVVSFLTAVTLLNTATGIVQTNVVKTDVRFRKLTNEEIDRYLKVEPAYDCAGSAKAEGLGISLMDNIRSEDPTALIGLPLIALSGMLRNEGILIP
ncbi:MAG: Maf family protein [Burkholderiales bacterium]